MQKVQIPSYPLRMPLYLRQLLEDMASKEDRSLNKEIVRRLEQSVRQEQQNAKK